MRAYEETLRHWQLTLDEERAVVAAIRGYLDAVPTDEFTSAVLLGIVNAVSPSQRALHIPNIAHNAALPVPTVVRTPLSTSISGAPQPPEFDTICTRPECFSNTPHDHGDGTGIKPRPITAQAIPELSDEQRARLEAEAAKIGSWVGGVKLATHEGADK